MDHPPCMDCPIGNRAPGHEDHDPSRGPCPNAHACDAECAADSAALSRETGRGRGYMGFCPGCDAPYLTHAPIDAPDDWAPQPVLCRACAKEE